MSQINFSAKITLKATISPSEDPAKVVGALEKVTGQTIDVVTSGPRVAKLVTDRANTLIRIRDQLRDRHVRSAARRRLLLNRENNSTSLMLNRQAATVGAIVLCSSADQSPLGPIYLTIRSKQIATVIDWLAAYEEG
jgi:predicted RNA binding protein with dsRBD fold (UPF0201 family)